jgi:TRAP-type mannitol/chloroaromatic compound transport system permease small subunit
MMGKGGRTVFIRRLAAAIDWVSLFSAKAVGGILLAMMILTCGDILSRSFLRRSIVGTLEIESNYFMVAAVFLPLAYGMISKQGHIRVEILLSRLPLRLQMGLEMVGLFLSLCVFGLVVWFGAAGAWRSWQAGETMVNVALPMWPGRVLVAMGGVLLCLQMIVRMGHLVISFFRD